VSLPPELPEYRLRGRRAALPPDSLKRALFERLKGLLNSQVTVNFRLEDRERPGEFGLEGVLVNCWLEPASSSVSEWLDDQFWTVKARLRKADGELVDVILDRLTSLQPVGNSDAA